MHKPKREIFNLPETSYKDWDEVLSNPQDIKNEIITTGQLFIPNWFFLNMGHPNAKKLKKEKIRVPVYCHLIRHSIQGDYLVDAGLDRSFQNDTHGNIQGLLRKILWPLDSFQEKGQDIETQLSEKKVNLKGIFFTHLHIDHVAGMQHLPKDIPIVVGKSEPYHSLGPLFYQNHFSGVDTILEIDFGKVQNIPPLGPCADIFGDGSFWAIYTPGHRKGHVSFLINGKEDSILLTGDACDIKIGFDNSVGPGFGSNDKSVAQRSLENMIDFANKYPQVRVIFGHEVP
ncbi:metallo-beta-lactamase domain protein [Candidatus Magnetomorum sp. HK-1]|nr:metallo-beta-lactamase domain protein [Candidatus Magnetomorum sp. HK-1]